MPAHLHVDAKLQLIINYELSPYVSRNFSSLPLKTLPSCLTLTPFFDAPELHN